MSERFIHRRIARNEPVDRVHTEKAREQYHANEEVFFGQNLLRRQQAARQVPDFYAQAPAAVVEQYLATAKRRYELDLNTTRERVAELAEEFPGEIEELIKTVLKAMPAVETFIDKELKLDYKNDAEFESLVADAIGNTEEEVLDGASRVEMRREMLIDEVSGVVVTRLTDDPDYYAKDIPEQLVLGLIEERRKQLEPLMSLVELLSRELMAEAVGDIMLACDRGIIPLSREEVASRLEGIQVVVRDTFVHSLEESWGAYNQDSKVIELSVSVTPAERKHVMIHELFHALGGETTALLTSDELTSSSLDAQWNDPIATERLKTKVGFGLNANESTFRDYGKTFMRRPRLYWLDEAITEQSTLDTLGIADGWAYKTERALLEKMVHAGIPKELFYQASYEDAALPTEDGGATMPHTRDLFKTAGQIFYPSFLADLDLVIRDLHSRHYQGKDKRNPSTGVDMVNEQWQSAPETFQKWLQTEALGIKDRLKPKPKAKRKK